MRVSADRERCCGSGICALTAPALFDQSEQDGLVVLRRPEPAPGQQRLARRAVELCPAGAISLTD